LNGNGKLGQVLGAVLGAACLALVEAVFDVTGRAERASVSTDAVHVLAQEYGYLLEIYRAQCPGPTPPALGTAKDLSKEERKEFKQLPDYEAFPEPAQRVLRGVKPVKE
jgi:hypothetical protein